MTALSYVEGQVTDAKFSRPGIIAHVCNGAGIWVGANAKAISHKWPNVRPRYYQWYRQRIRNDFVLGAVQFVEQTSRPKQPKLRVANLLAQSNHQRMIRFQAFERCLLVVAKKAVIFGAAVHIPKIGSDQTESWPKLATILQRTLLTNQIQVFVYCEVPLE